MTGTKLEADQYKILTIGHSTHPIDEFLQILDAHIVEQIVDVRTVPRSRHNPQFNKDVLPDSLGEISYQHLAGLGGLRHAVKDSVNTGWRNSSFRGYADYMQTEEFAQSLDQLICLGDQRRVAIMCAEAVPWRCHRSLIADALLVRGITVRHIISGSPPLVHKLTSFAHVEGLDITYPPLQP